MSKRLGAVVTVVDDDPLVRKSLERLIESFGFHAEAFASAEDYMTAREQRPDCLVLDVHLPGTSGIELQTRLRGSDDSVPIVFISAHDEGDIRDLAMQGGAVAFLTKPFTDESLLHSIARALETQREGA